METVVPESDKGAENDRADCVEEASAYGASRDVNPAPLTVPLIDKVFATMSPLCDIVAFVLVPSAKYNPNVVTDRDTRSPLGVTYSTSAAVVSLILSGFVVVFGAVSVAIPLTIKPLNLAVPVFVI